ncbi:MAG: lamin tail domain-containing protein, partial [Sedimentisphaerales bacterium]
MLRTLKMLLLCLVLLTLLFAAESWADEPTTPLISEFMAINGGKPPLALGELLDEDGDSSDWIEICNPTNEVFDLEGWYLTDDPDNLTRWEFPSVQVEPGGYMIVFASGKDRDDPDGGLHTNFKISSNPGFLALVEHDGRTIAHAYAYPQQFGDISYGLSSNAADLSSIPEGYFYDPTPGETNRGIVANLGPSIRDVTANPPQPTSGEDMVITAVVTETFKPVVGVYLVHRVNFDSSTGAEMFDDGLHNDGAAGDGLYGSVIDADDYGPGDMVRWKVIAYDVKSNVSQAPAFLLREGERQSPEYFGTVLVDPSIHTALPVFQYFVEDTGAAGTRAGTRASVFYGGEFYDNVFIRLRGGYTTHGRKFKFNDGHQFRFDPNLPRVDTINLNERGA